MSPSKSTPRPWAAPLALGVLLWASPISAAEVAVLKSTEAPAWRPALEALKRGLPGHTITEYDLRGDRNEAERILGALKGKAAVLVAFGPLAAEAARETASDQMLVFCMVQDPAKAGLLNNINASGVAFATPIKNQLAAFRLVYPRAVRIGVVHGPEESVTKLVQEAQKAAGVVRLVVTARVATTERDVPQALRALLKGEEAVDAIWLPPDPMLLGDATRRFLLAETLKAGKPVLSFSPAIVSEGALVSNGADIPSIGEQAAELVTRLLAGERTARGSLLIPKAELVINKKIADKLKIEIPADALKAASRVF
jgi:putative tryptophan/tyrosine transport system substrate-binding protein